MKARNILMYIAGSLLLPLYLASCGEDRWTAYAEQTATDRWIYDTMRVYYYWNDEMPDYNEANFFQAPATFFKALLSKEDKFSTLDSLTVATRAAMPDAQHSYGIEFQVGTLKGQTYALVLYTLPGSPAEEATLGRGSWIAAIDGEAISQQNYTRLYSGPAIQLTVGEYDAEGDSIQLLPTPVALPAARAVNDSPVYRTGTLQAAGKKVGYLAYHHFTAGSGDNYNLQLLDASAKWATEGIDEMVLDLRYNTGGAVSCANLLCTILAPATALGDTLGTLMFNPTYRPREQKLMLDPTLLQGRGKNLDLHRLFVLTGSNTASASELVINCLRPFMDVVLIGQKTVGKNVGSLAFQSEELMIEMHPIVCRLYNSLWESDYESGFAPQYTLDELSDPARLYSLGDANELLLAKALSLIAGTEEGDTQTRLSVLPFRAQAPASVARQGYELTVRR